ncbi:MAG: hypothetical protein D6730_21330 [Bacteroidetes bacterium]|nr:MAG: hypothetical protein D6730_21330 [Bacteroidota bacterium]
MSVYLKTFDFLFKNQGQLDNWEKTFEGFKSMRTAFEEITDEEQQMMARNGSIKGYENVISIIRNKEGELEETINIEHPIIATLVNEDGLIQIGDVVHKYTRNKIIRLKNASQKQVEELKLVNDQNLPSFGKISPIIRNTTPLNSSRAGNNTSWTTYDAGKKRVKGQLEYYNDGNTKGYSGCTHHSKKKFGIWWASKTNSLRLQATGTAVWGSVTENIDFDITETNVKKTATYALSYCLVTCQTGPVHIDGTHSCGDCNHGSSVVCYTDYY